MVATLSPTLFTVFVINQHIILHIFPPFLPFPKSRICEERERHKIKKKELMRLRSRIGLASR